MKVFVIGSMTAEDDIRLIANFYSSLGAEVDYVKKQPNKTLECLVEEALKRISEADMIVAVPKPDGTFGKGTIYEIAFAKHLKKITWEWTISEINRVKTRKIFPVKHIDNQDVQYSDELSKRVLYLCDTKKCGEKCSCPECVYTDDIMHAKNFENINGTLFEK